MNFLNAHGWNEHFQAHFENLQSENQKFEIARVIGQSKGHYRVLVSLEETIESSITSKLHNAAKEAADFPTVGDWVAITRDSDKQKSFIHHILPRRSLIQRKRSGQKQGMQLIAANIDHMLIVSSMNEDFDLARLSRYVSLANDAGFKPTLLLTKADICETPAEYVRQTQTQFPDLEILAISNFDSSIAQVEKFFAPQKTTVLVGSSGVGKSTLTNNLMGFDGQKTQGTSAESRGKHTTTTRDLRSTRLGGFVIDTPGMQEVADQTAPEYVSEKFSDIEELELQCKFTNCRHLNEPGCAIKRAIKNGELSAERWSEYQSAKTSVVNSRR